MKSRQFFRFTPPGRTVVGPRALETLPELAAGLGISAPMVLTDQQVAASGTSSLVISFLSEAAPPAAVFDRIAPDPDFTAAEAAAELYRSSGCDSLVAVGGGSVIDTAKGVNLLVSQDRESLRPMQGAWNRTGVLRPLIALPTTAGSGSEATQTAVLKDPDTGRTCSFLSPALVPDLAVLDPRLTETLPTDMQAAGGLDALTHAVEAYISLGKNPLSDRLALRATELIVHHLPRILASPRNQHARLQLSVAAHLAGTAFSNSMVGLVHTLGHSAGAVCGIPHGVCMSILLPYGLEYSSHRCMPLLADLLLPVAGRGVYDSLAEETRGIHLISQIRDFIREVHRLTKGAHPLRFRDILSDGNIPVMRPEHIAVIARQAAGDPSLFYSPEEFSQKEAAEVLFAAYWGYPLDTDLVKKGHQK